MKKTKEPKKDEKALVLKNYQLELFFSFLNIVRKTNADGDVVDKPLLLHGSKARARNKITDLVLERIQENEKNKREIIKKYAQLDKDGEPKTSEDGKNYLIKPDKQEKFSEEYKSLMNEDCVFDLLPSTRDQWIVIKNFMLNDMKSELDYNDTEVYEEICLAVEKI